jgi:hypothetical protein
MLFALLAPNYIRNSVSKHQDLNSLPDKLSALKPVPCPAHADEAFEFFCPR